MSKELQDVQAHGDIQSAGGPGGETPFYTALDQAKLLYVRRTPQEITRADNEQRKGRVNAVTLYRAGARFSVGRVYDELRRDPDQKLASIVLAAAAREGRLTDVIDRILYPNGGGRPLDRGQTDGERALIAYLLTVKACPVIRPSPKVDYVKLCATGAI